MLYTFTFPNGDAWNAIDYGFDTVVLENFRVVALTDGRLHRLKGPFIPRIRLHVDTPVTLVGGVHGIVNKTNGTISWVETEPDGDIVPVPNASLVYRMGTTIDKDLPPHHTVNGYLVPMEEEVATQEPVEDTEENTTVDVMKGKQSIFDLYSTYKAKLEDVSIPISDRSHATWKDKHLKEFAEYEFEMFPFDGCGEEGHLGNIDIMIDDTTFLWSGRSESFRHTIVDTNNVFPGMDHLREMKPGITFGCRKPKKTTVSGVSTHYVLDVDHWPIIFEKCDIDDRSRQYMHSYDVEEAPSWVTEEEKDVDHASDPSIAKAAGEKGLRKQSVAKARPQSMVKPPVPATKAHAELRELGFTMHDAARNGDCFPLSAMAGFEIPDLADVAAPTARTLETVKKARIAAVDLVTGDAPIGGIEAAIVRENEDLTDTYTMGCASKFLDAWKTLGHWRRAGGSTAFMFAVAHNLKRPVIVMEREGDAILDPCYIYAKRDGNGTLFTSPPRGGVPKTVPFVRQMPFADVLTALTERPKGYSLVEYDRDASHHSPVVYNEKESPSAPQDGDVTEEEEEEDVEDAEEDDVEDEEDATYTLEEHPPPHLYNVVRIKPPAAPAVPRTTFRPCDILVGCSKPYMHTGICDVVTCGARKRTQTDHYVSPDDVARDDVSDDNDGVDRVPEHTSSRPVARSAPQPPIMVHENSFLESFRTAMQPEVDTYDLGYYNSDGQRAYKYMKPTPHNGYYTQATVQGQTRYIGKFDRSLVAVYAIIATRRNPTRLGGDSGAVRRWIERMVTYFADESTSRATKRPRIQELA
jgi:hypothetical protein